MHRFIVFSIAYYLMREVPSVEQLEVTLLTKRKVIMKQGITLDLVK